MNVLYMKCKLYIKHELMVFLYICIKTMMYVKMK